MAKLIHAAIWREITSLVNDSNVSDGRNCVAVAYLGKNARKYLPLKEGDLLVVNMSREAAKAGQTNPDEIEYFIRHKVNVFSLENLHAKVYALGDIVIVGSANVSENSAKYLREAAILAKDKSLVAAASVFVKSLTEGLDQIGLSDVAEYRKYYKTSHGPGHGGGTKITRPIEPNDWCRQVLKQLAPHSIVELKGRSPYLELECQSAERVYFGHHVTPDGDFLCMQIYPGDTQSQAKVFYSNLDVKRLMALLASESRWASYSNLHLGYIQNVLHRCDPEVGIQKYLKFWEAGDIIPIETVWRMITSASWRICAGTR